MSGSELKLSGSWWELVGVDGSRWEWMGVGGRRWEWVALGGGGWVQGLVQPRI